MTATASTEPASATYSSAAAGRRKTSATATQKMPAPTASGLNPKRMSSAKTDIPSSVSNNAKVPNWVSNVLFEIAWISGGVQRIKAMKASHCTARNAVHHSTAIQSKKESSTRSAIATASKTSNTMEQRSAP